MCGRGHTHISGLSLGTPGLEVSAIGTRPRGQCPTSTGRPTTTSHWRYLNHAIDIGVNFLDTAGIYGIGGANERLLAKLTLMI